MDINLYYNSRARCFYWHSDTHILSRGGAHGVAPIRLPLPGPGQTPPPRQQLFTFGTKIKLTPLSQAGPFFQLGRV